MCNGIVIMLKFSEVSCSFSQIRWLHSRNTVNYDRINHYIKITYFNGILHDVYRTRCTFYYFIKRLFAASVQRLIYYSALFNSKMTNKSRLN